MHAFVFFFEIFSRYEPNMAEKKEIKKTIDEGERKHWCDADAILVMTLNMGGS